MTNQPLTLWIAEPWRVTNRDGPLTKGPFFLCNPHLLGVTPFALPTLPVSQTDSSGKEQDDNNVVRWQEFGYIVQPSHSQSNH